MVERPGQLAGAVTAGNGQGWMEHDVHPYCRLPQQAAEMDDKIIVADEGNQAVNLPVSVVGNGHCLYRAFGRDRGSEQAWVKRFDAFPGAGRPLRE